MSKVEMYTVDYCPYCHRALEYFESKGIEVENHDITLNEHKMREELGKKFAIKGRVTMPQILINKKLIGGHSELMKLNYSGELEKLLK